MDAYPWFSFFTCIPKKKKRSSLLDLQSTPRGCIGFSIRVQTVKLYLVGQNGPLASSLEIFGPETLFV